MRRTDIAGRRWRLWLAAAVAAMLAGPAAAAQADPNTYVERQGWSATGPLAPQEADHRLFVSVVADQEQARAYVDLRLPALSAEQLARSTLSLREDAGSTTDTQSRVRACALLTSLVRDGRVEGHAPLVRCDESVIAHRDANGVWSVPLLRFAASLKTAKAAGIALLPSAEDVTPTAFTVAFDSEQTRVTVPAASSAGSTSSDARPVVPVLTEDRAAADGGGSTAVSAVPVPSEPGVTEDIRPPSVAGGLGVGAAPSRQEPPGLLVAAAGSERRPSKLPVVLFLLALVVAALVLGMRGRVALPPVHDVRVPTSLLTRASAAVGLPAVILLTSSESTTFRFGVIAIVFIAAIGLHILVNTAGELSLAHAAFVGIPAFAAARLSAEAGLNPILAVPLAVVVGVLLGGLVALTALRARGLQVALATLAVGVATVQFLWFREWLVGPLEGYTIPNPSFFGTELPTSKSRTPVLVLLVLLAVMAGNAITRSKLGRGMSLLRSNPDVAAAAGIPVALYRATAYAFAGAFAGLAGGAYVFWVQQVTPQAFPLQLGFTYLLIAVLAGRGGLAGVAVAAVIVQVGAIFTFIPETLHLYVAPVVLILQVTRFQGGINESLRDIRLRINERTRSKAMAGSGSHEVRQATPPAAVTGVRLPVAIGALMVVAGFGAIGLAWYNTGNTNQLWIQNQYIVSGGLTGVGLIITGCALLLRDALLTGSAVVRGSVDIAAGQPPAQLPGSAASDGQQAQLATAGREPRSAVASDHAASRRKTRPQQPERVPR